MLLVFVNNMKKQIFSLSLLTSLFSFAPSAFAAANEITNPALGKDIVGLSAGAGMAFYIAQLWKTVVTVGGLAVMLYLIWGGIEWLISGGDKGKIESATHKITNSLIGLGVLVVSYAIVYFVGSVLKIDLLKPVFPQNY